MTVTNPDTPAPMTDVPPPKGRLPEFLPVEGNEGLMATYFTVKCAHAAHPGKHNASLLSLLEELARHRSSPSTAGGGWQAIETAPKDGTTLDLYHAETGRWPNCFWGKPQHDCGEMGQHCDSDWHRLKPGWVDGVFNEPITANFTRFSHYMLPAEPPK